MQALQVKNNISRFSGFVWHENEVKDYKYKKENPPFVCTRYSSRYSGDFLFIVFDKWYQVIAWQTWSFWDSIIAIFFPLLQEKQMIKVKEKLDKCNKEKLSEFCDVLDIQIAKATTRKVRWFSTVACSVWNVLMSK